MCHLDPVASPQEGECRALRVAAVAAGDPTIAGATNIPAASYIARRGRLSSTESVGELRALCEDRAGEPRVG